MATVQEIYKRLNAEDPYYAKFVWEAERDDRPVSEKRELGSVGDNKMLKPISKVQVAGVVGAIVSLIAWVLNYFYNIELPAEVGAAVTTVLMFIAAYIVPIKADDEYVVVPNK